MSLAVYPTLKIQHAHVRNNNRLRGFKGSAVHYQRRQITWAYKNIQLSHDVHLLFYILVVLVSHHKPSVAKHQHKTCKNSEMLHSDIVTNSTFDGQHDNFTFLGRVGSMKECLGLCCTFTKCGLAYLENNTRCFSVQCDDPKLCKIKNDTHGSGHNDIKMSLMIKSSGNQRGNL